MVCLDKHDLVETSAGFSADKKGKSRRLHYRFNTVPNRVYLLEFDWLVGGRVYWVTSDWLLQIGLLEETSSPVP